MIKKKNRQIKDNNLWWDRAGGDEQAPKREHSPFITNTRESNGISWSGATGKNRGCFRDNVMERLPPHFLKEMRPAGDF